jgi:SPOR domain
MTAIFIRHLGLLVITTAMLAGCVMGKGAGTAPATDDATEAGVIAADGANPITGDAIEATPIDGAPIAAAPGDGDVAPLDEPAADEIAAEDTTTPVVAQRSTRLVDRDVEAPDVFQVTDQALWDGRPSLGGVWVASPDATDPERVILRNAENGKFVIGALFKRERDNPGPKLQISSDAAEALGVLAGQPISLNVTALRREEAPEAAPAPEAPILDAAESVEPVAEIAAAAIEAAEVAAPAVAAPTGGSTRVQVGIFSVEANATRTADTLAKAGIKAEVRKESAQGKAFWSVIASGDNGVLKKVKAAGFADAYALSR